jgi:hypothetical protein
MSGASSGCGVWARTPRRPSRRRLERQRSSPSGRRIRMVAGTPRRTSFP